jgi:membrane protease YdiL (CAAX protease family)
MPEKRPAVVTEGFFPAEGRGRAPLWLEFSLFIGAAAGISLVVSLLWGLGGGVASAALPATAAERLLYLLSVCVAAPVLEEWLFRGGVQRLLRPLGPRFALWCTSAFFALMHTSLWDMPAAFLLSLLLCSAMERRRSFWLCVALHAAYNLLATVVAGWPGGGAGAFWMLAALAVAGLLAWVIHTLCRGGGYFWPPKGVGSLRGGAGGAAVPLRAPELIAAFGLLLAWRLAAAFWG